MKSSPVVLIMRVFILSFLFFYSSASLVCADWTLPLTFRSGNSLTRLSLGIQAGASNGFDAGRDTPHYPYGGDLLYACFPHSEWGVTFGGERAYVFSRDIRGSLPQEFPFEVRSSQSTVTISWNASTLPTSTVLQLYNPMAGTTVDMKTTSSYRFSPGGMGPFKLIVRATQGDVSPPSSPQSVSIEGREKSLFVSWERNSEADLAGYKVHFGMDSDTYQRTIDVGNVTNYSLMNPENQETYYVALTAYDQNGNESDYSSEVFSTFLSDREPPFSPVGLAITQTAQSLALRWDANSEEDLAGYKVYIGTSFGDYRLLKNVGLTPACSLSKPADETTYYFVVSAYDQNGNESELSSAETFQTDSNAPVIALLPANILVETDAWQEYATVSWVAPTATDDVDGFVPLAVSSAPQTSLRSGSHFPVGTTTITYRGTDAAGNLATESFTVTVNSASPDAPVINQTPANMTVTAQPGASDVVVSWLMPNAVDHYGDDLPLTVTTSPISGLTNGARFPVGTTTVVFSAVDSAGNRTSTSFTVKVVKEQPEAEATSANTGSVFLANLPGQGGQEDSARSEEGGEGTGEAKQKENPADSDESVEKSSAEPEQNAFKVKDLDSKERDGRSLAKWLELDAHPWKLITIPLHVPFQKPFKDFAALSANLKRLLGWDGQSQDEIVLKRVRPGIGFWLQAGKGYFVVEGEPVAGKTFSVDLSKGKNLIGNPFLDTIPFAQVQAKNNDQVLPLLKAVEKGWVNKELQGYSGGEFVELDLSATGHFEPWMGYWLTVKTPCELIFHVEPIAVKQQDKTKADKAQRNSAVQNAPQREAKSAKSVRNINDQALPAQVNAKPL